MAGVVLPLFSLLVGAMLLATVTSETINLSYEVMVVPIDDKIILTLKATAMQGDLSGTGLWKMGVFVSQNDDPTNTTGAEAINEQALNQAEQDQSVVPPKNLTFEATLDYAYTDLGGCERDYKFVCIAFGMGDKPVPNFTLLQGYKTCLKLGQGCLDDVEKAVSFGGYSWSLGGDQFIYTVTFLDSSRKNVEGTNLWKLWVGLTKKAIQKTSQYYLDLKNLLSAEQSSTSLTDGNPLTFSLPLNESEVGCGVDQFRYLCFTFGKGDDATPDYPVSNSQRGCGLAYNCDDEF